MTNQIQVEDLAIAVADKDLAEWGCPYCGYLSGYTPMSGVGAALWVCDNCQRECVALSDGLTRSPIGLGSDKSDESYYPELQVHPRQGTPKHGRPESGGEFFRSRGIGLSHQDCFICGGEKRLLNNIAAFVQDKAAGERVVAMFQHGAWLDYRESEPNRVQVKIGACDEHKGRLEKLNELTQRGVIKDEMILSLFDTGMSNS